MRRGKRSACEAERAVLVLRVDGRRPARNLDVMGGAADGTDRNEQRWFRLRDERPQRVQRHRCNRQPGSYLHLRLPADKSTGLEQSCSLILRFGSSGTAPRGSGMRPLPPRVNPLEAIEDVGTAASGALLPLLAASAAQATSSKAKI